MKSMKGCPSFRRLSHATVAGADDALRAHLAACIECRRVTQRIATLAETSRELPWEPSPPGRARKMEAAILAGIPEPRPRGGRSLVPWAFGAGLSAAAAAALLVVALQPPARPAPPNRIHASPAARFAHITRHPVHAGAPSSEVVELVDGSVSIEVEALRPDQRFLVVTSDAEVEVRGTRFEVVADEGKLLRVSVQEGKVEVRRGGASRLLLPGDRWERPPEVAAVVAADPPEEATPFAAPAGTDSAALAPKQRQRPIAPRLQGSPPVSAGRDETDEVPTLGERAFASGWKALREGDAEAAAGRFAEVSELGGDDDLQGDAAFWRIVALARSGAEGAAEKEMETFLRLHPTADRAGEVALMLGLRRLAAGDREEARALFERAVRTSSEPTKGRAQEALRGLEE